MCYLVVLNKYGIRDTDLMRTDGLLLLLQMNGKRLNNFQENNFMLIFTNHQNVWTENI